MSSLVASNLVHGANGECSMLYDFRVLVCTYNVNGQHPKKSLEELLGFRQDLYGINELPDLYAVGFQEVAMKASDIILEDPWAVQVKETLSKWDYVKLKQIRLNGLLLLLFTKRNLVSEIHNIQAVHTRTGMGGLGGNKGAVSIRMAVSGTSLCIVNSHLHANIDDLDQRVHDYNIIIDDQAFDDSHTPHILSHDYVIWFGDLNFRIDEFSTEEVNEKATSLYTNAGHRKMAIEQMQKQDQLIKVQREGLAFSEFEENRPSFMPTYKFIVGTDRYDLNRKPAWTDRVLFRATKNAYENVTLAITKTYYHSHENYKESDHKPVSALFAVKVFNNRAFDVLNINEPTRISFLPIPHWHVYHEYDAWFTLSSRAPDNDGFKVWDDKNIAERLSEHDWVALFAANFTSIEDHLCSVWVNPVPQTQLPPNVREETEEYAASHRCPSPFTSRGSHQSYDAGPAAPRCSSLWFKVTFPEHDMIVPGTYRLVYFSHEHSNVLGMSAPFEIKYSAEGPPVHQH